jgi:tetratricopeptide (TPR) repeat protein
VIVFLFGGVLATSARAGQEGLSHAKDLYASAAYDEALALLDRLPNDSAPAEKAEAAEYRVFCLLALQRSDDARTAIDAIVRADPFRLPTDSQASPRIRAVFQEERRKLLPEIVQRSYADAKAAFDKKDPQAVTAFDRLLSLLDDPDTKGLTGLGDFRTLASGFRDLAKAAAEPSPAASTGPGPSASTPPAPAPPARRIYTESEPGVIAPAGVSQPTPHWRPPVATVRAGLEYKGILEVLIDEGGRVEAVTLREPIYPSYDGELIKMVRTWKFNPATKDGVPVRYLKLIEIKLRPQG